RNSKPAGPEIMKAKKPPILQYVCLALLFALAWAYQIRSMIYAFPTYFHDTAAAYPCTVGCVKDQPSLQFVNRSARQAGVENNDVLLTVNGRPLTGLAVYGEAIRTAKPGDALRIEFRRPAETSLRSATLQLDRAS